MVIVSPAAEAANNGNARTAQRWRDMLAARGDVRVVRQWPDEAASRDEVMIALHARRSAASIRAWAQARPRDPLVVVLTGTDLYQDVAQDAEARHSLEAAHRLVVLQELGLEALAPPLRAKARVIVQSTPAMAPLPKTRDALDALMVGHLRAVKAPRVLFDAARSLAPSEGIRISHIGADDAEPALGDQARATERECPHYRWLGALPHAATRDRIRAAHVLVHTSILEGGAHVVMEAVRSGTPVIASRVPGNVGMLGSAYGGYFEAGDVEGLVRLLRECRATQGSAYGLLARLGDACEERSSLFDEARERDALAALLGEFN